MRLRSRAGVAGSFQMPGRSVMSRRIPGLLFLGELAGVLFAGFVVGGLGVAQGAQGGVPVGFEGFGDEPVGGVDGEVAAAGQVGVVAGALDVGGAQGVGFGGAVLEFGGDGQGGFGGQRGELADQELADLLVESVPGDDGARRVPVGDAVALAHVGGRLLAAAGVVADGHPVAAAAADDDALQQRGAFAGWTGGAVGAVRGGVGGQPGEVGLVLLHGDVSGVGAGDERDPFLARQSGGDCLAAGQFPVPAPAEGERAGVAGVVQHAQHDVVLQRFPVQVAFAGPARCRQGKASPSVLNAFTQADADPVASKVVNRRRRAPWTAASGSRVTCPAAS